MLANLAPALGGRLVFAGIHLLVYQIGYQTKKRRRASVGLMLGRRRRRRLNIKTALGEPLGYCRGWSCMHSLLYTRPILQSLKVMT